MEDWLHFIRFALESGYDRLPWCYPCLMTLILTLCYRCEVWRHVVDVRGALPPVRNGEWVWSPTEAARRESLRPAVQPRRLPRSSHHHISAHAPSVLPVQSHWRRKSSAALLQREKRVIFAEIYRDQIPCKVHFYRPQRSCGQGNIFTPVCNSVHRGGSASVHAGIPHPSPQTRPPQDQTPPEQTPPWEQTHPPTRPPGPDTPLEQTPLGADTPPREQKPPPQGSRLQHTVYEQPVRILLECILVKNMFIFQLTYLIQYASQTCWH